MTSYEFKAQPNKACRPGRIAFAEAFLRNENEKVEKILTEFRQASTSLRIMVARQLLAPSAERLGKIDLLRARIQGLREAHVRQQERARAASRQLEKDMAERAHLAYIVDVLEKEIAERQAAVDRLGELIRELLAVCETLGQGRRKPFVHVQVSTVQSICRELEGKREMLEAMRAELAEYDGT